MLEEGKGFRKRDPWQGLLIVGVVALVLWVAVVGTYLLAR